ncbi:hypothetical protein ACFUCQ_14915 [Streptomyces sp. NPDC057197]|uniref:hypothetical protein n=1 Tax=Streptomyces sp. NPDC057197 TaxID=3346045 RepID=UPI0036393AF8
MLESEHYGALTRLISWADPLDGVIETAGRCDLSEGLAVILDRPTVTRVLRRCISGELDVRELPTWASAVHMLDRVEIRDEESDVLTQFLFEVSTPELFTPVTFDVCRQWIARLEEPPKQ